ncbi:MAG: hypothetical protein R3D51_11610 [Hyphomicrobiaceae bacterium]
MPAAAGEPVVNPSLTKTWVFNVGAVFQNLDGGATADINGGGGGSVGFSQIGLDEHSTSVFAAARWRFSDRWRLDFTFDTVDTDGSRTVSHDIEFGFITIPTSAAADSSLRIRNYSAFVGYSFVKDEQSEFGARLGLTILDAGFSLQGTATVLGASGSTEEQRADVIGPVPTIGLYGTYALSNRVSLEGSVDGLVGSLGSYSGHYVAAMASLNYWIDDTFAVGLGYRYVNGKLEHEGNVLTKGVDIEYSGPVVQGSVGF